MKISPFRSIQLLSQTATSSNTQRACKLNSEKRTYEQIQTDLLEYQRVGFTSRTNKYSLWAEAQSHITPGNPENEKWIQLSTQIDSIKEVNDYVPMSDFPTTFDDDTLNNRN